MSDWKTKGLALPGPYSMFDQDRDDNQEDGPFGFPIEEVKEFYKTLDDRQRRQIEVSARYGQRRQSVSGNPTYDYGGFNPLLVETAKMMRQRMSPPRQTLRPKTISESIGGLWGGIKEVASAGARRVGDALSTYREGLGYMGDAAKEAYNIEGVYEKAAGAHLSNYRRAMNDVVDVAHAGEHVGE